MFRLLKILFWFSRCSVGQGDAGRFCLRSDGNYIREYCCRAAGLKKSLAACATCQMQACAFSGNIGGDRCFIGPGMRTICTQNLVSNPPPDPMVQVRLSLELSAVSYRQLSCGEYHNCGLNTTGGISCWSTNAATGPYVGHWPGSPSKHWVQVLLSTVSRSDLAVQVVAGEEVTCGLSNLGKISCWGNNNASGLSFCLVTFWQRVDHFRAGLLVPPSGTFVRLALGSFGCAISATGAMSCWGPIHSYTGPNPPTTAAFVSVTGGNNRGYALTSQGVPIQFGGADPLLPITAA